MRPPKLKNSTSDELVELFVKYALGQDDALLEDDIPLFNRLYGKIEDIKGELKSRHGDQRHLLTRLYRHANAQVRLKAALATLAVDPTGARSVLKHILQAKEHPPTLDAGMMLRSLGDGSYMPT